MLDFYCSQVIQSFRAFGRLTGTSVLSSHLVPVKTQPLINKICCWVQLTQPLINQLDLIKEKTTSRS